MGDFSHQEDDEMPEGGHNDYPEYLRDFDKWPEERKRALFEVSESWHAMSTLGRWGFRILMVLAGAASALYYVLQIWPGQKH